MGRGAPPIFPKNLMKGRPCPASTSALRVVVDVPKPAAVPSLEPTNSAAVILLQIVGYDFCVALVDRRAERLDHFGDFGIPYGGVGGRRVHLHVIKALAGTTIGFDLVEARPFLELDQILAGRRGNGKCDGEERNGKDTHYFFLTPR